jgi:hypothetical protein
MSVLRRLRQNSTRAGRLSEKWILAARCCARVRISTTDEMREERRQRVLGPRAQFDRCLSRDRITPRAAVLRIVAK